MVAVQPGGPTPPLAYDDGDTGGQHVAAVSAVSIGTPDRMTTPILTWDARRMPGAGGARGWRKLLAQRRTDGGRILACRRRYFPQKTSASNAITGAEPAMIRANNPCASGSIFVKKNRAVLILAS